MSEHEHHRQRHPGGRPRSRAGLDRRPRRRAAELHRPAGASRPGQVHDVAHAHRPGAHRAARARRAGVLRRRLAVLAVRRPARPVGRDGPAGPPGAWRRRRGHRRDRAPRRARGDRVVQVAQVDSTYLLGTRDWTEVDVPAHCSALGKVLLRLRRAAAARRARSSSCTDAHRRPPRGAARATARAPAARLGESPSDELEIGLDRHRRPGPRHRGDVVAALGVSGPTARLEGRLDELGRNLSATTPAQLSRLLRGTNTRKEGVA